MRVLPLEPLAIISADGASGNAGGRASGTAPRRGASNGGATGSGASRTGAPRTGAPRTGASSGGASGSGGPFGLLLGPSPMRLAVVSSDEYDASFLADQSSSLCPNISDG